MSDLNGVNDTLPVRIGGVSSTSGLPDNYADVNAGGSLQVAGQGVAGTPAGGVVSIQGVASGTAVPVSQSGSWTVAATQSGTWTTGRTWTLASGTDSVSVVQSTSPWITKDQADGPVTPGAVASFSQLVGGQYNSTQPTLTNTQQAALQLDPLGNLRTTLPDRQVTGTLGALNATITISGTNGFSSGGLELDGSFSGTIQVEGTVGGTQYANIGLFNVDAGYTTSLIFTGATTQSIYQLVGIGSYTTIKATVTAYTSGSLAATLNLSSGIDLLNVVSPYAPNFNVTAVGNAASGTADSGNGIKVSGIYNSATPTFANGQRADLQTDSSGNLKITGTVIANNASVSQVNATTPSFATYVGGLASTSPPTWGAGDLAPLSIVNVGGYLRTTDVADGPVTPGTAALNSILTGGQYNSTLPTLTTAQQSAIQLDSSGRLLIGSIASALPAGANVIGGVTQSGTWTVQQGSGPWTQNLTQVGGSAVALGQTTMSASIPVTIASNQSALAVSQSGTWTTGRTWTLASGTDSVSVVQSTSPWITKDQADGPVTPGTVATYSQLAGGQYNSTPPTLTTGQQSAIQLDSSGRLIISPTTQGPLAEDHNYGTVGANTLRTASQIGNATGGADFAAGNSSAQTLRVVIASNQVAIPVSQSGTWTTGRTWTLASGTDSVSVVQSTSPWTIQGDSASGASKAGNPVQIGGVFNTTQPTVTTGQTVEAQATARGALIVATGVDNFNIDNISGTISLPTNAATAANQATEITSLQSIDNPVGSVGAGAAGTSSFLAGVIFNTALPTLTNGQQAAVQADSSGRLLVGSVNSITSALPSGTNTIGALVANQSVNLAQVAGTTTVTAGTAGLLAIGGPAAAGAAVSGNPVQIGGSDGTDVREVSLNLKGTQGAYGVAVQDLKDAGRNLTCYYMASQVVSTATDTLMSLTGYKSGAAVGATTTPAVVSAGKTYRINMIIVTYIAVTTAGTVHFALRANTGGVVVIGSPEVFEYAIGGPSTTAGTSQTICIPIPDGLEFAAGTGIGVSMQGFGATGTAAAVGYGMIALKGYEY